MRYDADRVVAMVEHALAERSEDAEPGFYAVVGSHCYGYDAPDSDVDVRGMHLSDGRRYMLLDRPAERLRVNADGVTPGFEAYAGVELGSDELRTLAVALSNGDVGAVEAVLVGEVVLDTVPEYTDALRDIVASALPLGLPRAYAGMAHSVRQSAIVGEPATPAKPYLQALRALLAGAYVREQGDLLGDVGGLSSAVVGDDAVVADLVATRRTGERPDDELQARADALLDRLFERVDYGRDTAADAGSVGESCRDRLWRRLDGWMLDLRREVTQPL